MESDSEHFLALSHSARLTLGVEHFILSHSARVTRGVEHFIALAHSEKLTLGALRHCTFAVRESPYSLHIHVWSSPAQQTVHHEECHQLVPTALFR